MTNIFTQFTEWGIRLLSKLDIEPFFRARILLVLGYFVFASLISFSVAFVLDGISREIFSYAFQYPEFLSEAQATAIMEEVRWSFRLFNIFIYAIGIYFLVGITHHPIRKAAEFQKRFIANISHELRTPLAIAKTETEVALRNKKELTKEKAIELLEQNLQDVTRVARIIQFLTTLSDLSQRTAKETREALSISHIVKRVYSAFVERTDLSVNLTLAIGDEGKIRGNAIAIEKLLSNLVRNALTYTPEGGSVTIGVSRENGVVTLAVTDTGIGIAAEDIPNLFEPFYRAKNAAQQGSGLGLSIVREIAKLHDAKVKVASVLGQGTEVTVAFPARAD